MNLVQRQFRYDGENNINIDSHTCNCPINTQKHDTGTLVKKYFKLDVTKNSDTVEPFILLEIASNYEIIQD